MQVERDFVDRWSVHARENFLRAHVAEKRDLFAHFVGKIVVRAAHDEIRLDAERTQLFHRMLRRLGFDLVGGGDIGHERAVHEEHIARWLLFSELAGCLDERLPFDVTDRAPDFGDDDIRAALVRNAAQTLLDRFRHMRNDLHGAAQKVATPLARDKRLIDGPLREIRFPRKAFVDKALVMTQVEIAFMAIVGHEDLAVLEGAHGARVDIEVWIHLLHGHAIAAMLKQVPQRGGRDAFAKRRDNASGHKDVLCHDAPLVRVRCGHGVVHSARKNAWGPRPQTSFDCILPSAAIHDT